MSVFLSFFPALLLMTTDLPLLDSTFNMDERASTKRKKPVSKRKGLREAPKKAKTEGFDDDDDEEEDEFHPTDDDDDNESEESRDESESDGSDSDGWAIFSLSLFFFF